VTNVGTIEASSVYAYNYEYSGDASVEIEADNITIDSKGIGIYSCANATDKNSVNIAAIEKLEINGTGLATASDGNTYDYGVICAFYGDANNNVELNAEEVIITNKNGGYAIYAYDSCVDIGKNSGKVNITGDVLAYSGEVGINLGNNGSILGNVESWYGGAANIDLGTNGEFTGWTYAGVVDSYADGVVNITVGANSTWNLSYQSSLTTAAFAKDSVFNIDGSTYLNNNGTNGVYALTAVGDNASLTVTNGAKLQIDGIAENATYNIAQGFGVDASVGANWTIDNNLMTGEWKVADGDGLQVTTVAKDAGEIANDMGVDSGTASALGSIIEAANNVGDEELSSAQENVVKFAKEIANAPAEQAADAAEAVVKMAEAGGNSATAASIVKNVTGVTNDRLSFNCGHSAPHKGGHGVGLFEEGSGADIWVEYVHGKDEVEDMKSTAGASSYEGQYNGLVMGVDFKKVGKFQSGVAFNYGEGDTNSVGTSSRTHSDYDFWGIGYYGNIHNDDSNVIFDINYAKTDSDVTNYNTAAGVVEASPETTTWTAGVKLEKLYQNENVQIVPYTGLRYMSIDPDDYKTKCGSYSYSMDRQDIWLLPVGVSIRQEIANDNGWTVSPRVDLSYIWAFGDTDSNMEFATALNTKTNIGYDVMDDGSFLGLVGIEAHKGQWGYGVAYSYQKGDHSESKKWYVDVNYSF